MMSKKAVIGGGCFWCLEAAFKEIQGVEKVKSGYAGGHTQDPSYRDVCSGKTGHAEVVKIEYEPEILSYSQILEIFFELHDPTTRDKEGPDKGSQYRSIILYRNQRQKEAAKKAVHRIEDKQGEVVTEIKELEEFYEAEEKHQDYFQKNPGDGYCNLYAAPKIEKAKKAEDRL